MARSRSSAKQAGTRHERLVADYLAAEVDDRIDRRPKSGAKDKGDIANVRHLNGRRIVVECKDEARVNLAGWATETETERLNDGALVGVFVHKRRGKARPEDQWVTMTMANFVALLTGARPSTDKHAEGSYA